MPVYDRLNEFSNGQSIVGSVGSIVSSDVVDFGVASVFHVNPPELHVEIEEAVLSGGAATVNVILEHSDDNSTFSTLAQSGAIGKADLVKGYKPAIAVPKTHKRYLGLKYTIAVAATTAGKVNSYLYPRG